MIIINAQFKTDLSSFLTADIEALYHNPLNAQYFPPDKLEMIKATYAKAFSRDIKVMIGISVLGLIVSFFSIEANPPPMPSHLAAKPSAGVGVDQSETELNDMTRFRWHSIVIRDQVLETGIINQTLRDKFKSESYNRWHTLSLERQTWTDSSPWGIYILNFWATSCISSHWRVDLQNTQLLLQIWISSCKRAIVLLSGSSSSADDGNPLLNIGSFSYPGAAWREDYLTLSEVLRIRGQIGFQMYLLLGIKYMPVL